MRKTLLLVGALVAPALAPLGAQTVRWNDRPTENLSAQAPRVRVSIQGGHVVPYGAPVTVQFEVSDNAYVTVVRVDGMGRMSILFPETRSRRAAVRGGQLYYARNMRLGNFSFIAMDRMSGGYVFAIASYAPLDFSSFENRDYERYGAYSAFTRANREFASQPDVYIDRFAASVLWDRDTPYDYDVDYYYSAGFPTTLNAYALCGSLYRNIYAPFISTAAFYDWDAWDISSFGYRSQCRNFYGGLNCLSYLGFFGSSYCLPYYRDPVVIVQNPPVGGTPTEPVPNEGVVRGGLFTPTPVPVAGGGDSPPLERVARIDQAVRFGDSEWDNLKSLPARATRKMKATDATPSNGLRKEATGKASSASPGSAGFDGPIRGATKTEKRGITDAGGSSDAATRLQPPPREPTKTKGNAPPRREVGSRSTFGGTRTSNPRPAGIDRSSRPTESTRPASTPAPAPTIQSSGTEKKKPPTL